MRRKLRLDGINRGILDESKNKYPFLGFKNKTNEFLLRTFEMS